MNTGQSGALAPILTPHGHLLLAAEHDATILDEPIYARMVDAFTRGTGHGLLHLGATEIGNALPPVFAWWRDFSAHYITALCATTEASAGDSTISHPAAQVLDDWVVNAPPMTGAEYLTADVLIALWGELNSAFRVELAESKKSLQDFLKALHPAWNLVGRVHFNLAGNRKDAEAPFAFIATYTSRLSPHGKAQHHPLSQALHEYSDGKSRAQLLPLLKPVQRAAESCDWLQAIVESGEIYHPLRWTPADAYQFLLAVPQLEAAGIIIRAPGTWRAGRPARPLVKASVGTMPPSLLGKDALLDFSLDVTLDGEHLSAADIRKLLAGGDGLQL